MEDRLDQARKNVKAFIAAHKKWLETDGRELKKFEMKALCGLEEVPEEFRDPDEEPLIKDYNDLDFYELRYLQFEPYDVSGLIIKAKTDPDAYQACLDLIIYCLREDIPIDGFHDFLLNHLQKHSSPPNRKGPNTYSSLLRNILITRAVIIISRQTGLPCSRNDASDPHSICDIVAEELGLTYETVKKIWLKHKASPYFWSPDTYRHFF